MHCSREHSHHKLWQAFGFAQTLISCRAALTHAAGVKVGAKLYSSYPTAKQLNNSTERDLQYAALCRFSALQDSSDHRLIPYAALDSRARTSSLKFTRYYLLSSQIGTTTRGIGEVSILPTPAKNTIYFIDYKASSPSLVAPSNFDLVPSPRLSSPKC